MPKQPALTGLRDAMKKKITRREQFLGEMDAVVPWGRLLGVRFVVDGDSLYFQGRKQQVRLWGGGCAGA